MSACHLETNGPKGKQGMPVPNSPGPMGWEEAGELPGLQWLCDTLATLRSVNACQGLVGHILSQMETLLTRFTLKAFKPRKVFVWAG